MKEKYFSFKLIILTIILFTCLFIFSVISLALIPGDFGSAEGPTPDGCVDFEDLMIFALAYGSTPPDANWNEVCDIASQGGVLQPDGVIDFEDLMIFAMHYGEGSPTTKGSIDGIIMVPEGSKSRDLSGWVPLPNATVTLTDSAGQTHTIITDENGNYSFSQVSPGSNYIITATGEVAGNTIVLKDIVPQLKAGEEYDAGTADAESTALALVVEDILDKDIEPDLNAIQQSTSYNTLTNEVLSVLEQHNNITTDPEIKNTVYNSLDELIEPWDGWFCSEEWDISPSEDKLAPPGPNYYSNSINNVWKDEQENLHLRIIKREDKWYCAAVYSKREGLEYLGYGKYKFDLGKVVMGVRNGDGEISYENDLDENIVIGLFTYDGSDGAHKSHNEIDIEFARWGDSNGDLGNFVVWYDGTEGNENRNLHSFPIDLGDNSTHSFEWTANNIIYISSGIPYCPLYPESFDYKEGDEIVGSSGEGYGYIPIPREERAHMNLWLYDDTGNNVQGFPADLNVEEVEVVIKSFQFTARDNHSPEITEFTINPPSPININQPTILTCHAADEDGDILAYNWSAPDGGTITGSGEIVTWTAPDTPGTYKVACHVSDLYGGYCDVWDYIEVIDCSTSSVHNLTKDTYYNTIQAALDDADSNNTIEVSDGTYDESITFPSGKKVILKSINGNSSTIIRGDDGSNTVTLNYSPEGTTLEGFTITHADGITGKGIFNYNGNLTINNCVISNNSTVYDGGGIENYYNSALTINDSTISGNSAIGTEQVTNRGGGIYNYSNSTLTITGSTVFGNTSSEVGGGISNDRNSTLTIADSTVSGNSTEYDGGGIVNVDNSTLTITRSIVSDNTSWIGGGICNTFNNSSLTITESTISYNTAAWGGGGISNYEGILTITSSTISDNSTEEIGGGICLYSGSVTINIGGSSNTDTGNFNEFSNNYKTGNAPSPDQHICNSTGDCHMDYPYNNYYPDTQPPNAPVLYDLFYSPSSGADYDLTWSDESSSGAAGYEIQESKYSDFSSIIGGQSTASTSSTFNHSVTENTYYYYRVISMNSEGVYSNSWSNTVEVIVSGIPKASITVETRDHNDSLISGGISYILYDDSNPWNEICNSGSSSSNSYTFENLEAGTYNIESYKYNDYSLQGYYAAKVDINLLEGENKNITIYTSAIAVCTVDSNDNFIPSDGLEYVLYLEDESGSWRYIKTVAAPSNNYTFTKIPSGIYNIEAYTYGNPRGTAVDIYVAPKELVPRIIIAN